MAEENPRSAISADDISVLRTLLHTIHGISPVSSPELAVVPADE
ncbi:MAG: hypothetical protein WBK76_02320 [Candidatus Saccharimonadales bacterium]